MSRQYFEPTVMNRLQDAIILANFSIDYGRFYDPGNRFADHAGAGGTVIQGRQESTFGHCGRDSSPTGTEGTFEVRLHSNNKLIGKVYWDSPFSGTNKLEARDVDGDYDISFADFSMASGPLGTGKIKVRLD